MNKKQQTIDTYNTSAKEMARKFSLIGARTSDIEKVFSRIPKFSPSVLEIGFGSARDAQEIVKHTDNYLGIDISSEMVCIAQETCPEFRDSFLLADVEVFDFPVELDIVFSFASLLHSPREVIQSILDRVHDALNPGGIFFISLKYSESYKELTKTDEFGTRTYYHYSPEEILTLGGNKYSFYEIEYQDVLGQKWFSLTLWK